MKNYLIDNTLFVVFKVLIKPTLYHAVVKLTLFIGGTAEAALELRVGGKHQNAPLGRHVPHGLAKGYCCHP